MKKNKFSRRNFLSKTAITGLTGLLGTRIVFAENLSKGLSKEMEITVNEDGYVCTQINLGASQITFPNEEVDTFIESSLILPFIYKKTSG